jgi:hypothetical protein
MVRNQSLPPSTMAGTEAIVSTLFTTWARRRAPTWPGRGLEARVAAAALQRVEQRRLLAADVRAGAGVHHDVEVEARAEDVLAEVALGVGLLDGRRTRRIGCSASPRM